MTGGQLDIFGGPEDPLDAPSPCGLEPYRENPSNLWLGTCSWNHADWDGHFYPAGLPKTKQLRYYARFCNAVEVDSSFYRVPARSTLERWRDETPEDFMFALKAPRTLTHDANLILDDSTARADWTSFIENIAALGEKLGAVLLQLGPRTTILQFDHLRAVADSLPLETRLAVEFRHPSWHHAQVNGWLAERGASRVWADHYLDPERHVSENDRHAFAETGSFRFIRLLGDTSKKYEKGTGERRFRYGEVLFDRTEDRGNWIDRIRDQLSSREVFAFINNHYEGFSLFTAREIRRTLTT